MKRLPYIWLSMVLLLSCKDENPTPESFLEYELPYYQELDGGLLLQLDEQIEQGAYGDMHSLLILRNDKIVFEKYYGNYTKDDLHPIDAATQSIVSAVIGTQLNRNEKFSLSSKIIDYFPEYKQYFEDAPQKDQIETRHLLSHTSGFWWDEWSQPFGAESNDAYVMSQSDDWIANVLATPMIKEPGNNFNYNSGNAVLLAPILEKEAGVDLETLAGDQLFKPLDIREWKWDHTPGGYVNAAWGLHLKPVDMAKIGYLFLNKGYWINEPLFSESWLATSTVRRSWASTYLTYGYHWWGFSRYSNIIGSLKRNDLYFAWGAGGQFIFVVPHLNMVVVMTGGNYNNNDTKAIEILGDYIFPSVTDQF